MAWGGVNFAYAFHSFLFIDFEFSVDAGKKNLFWQHTRVSFLVEGGGKRIEVIAE